MCTGKLVKSHAAVGAYCVSTCSLKPSKRFKKKSALNHKSMHLKESRPRKFFLDLFVRKDACESYDKYSAYVCACVWGGGGSVDGVPRETRFVFVS
jgi:hypothetical protein